MRATIELEPLERLEIRTLIDNYSDLMLADAPPLKRLSLSDDRAKTEEPPVAGHGFSLVMEACTQDASGKVMMDAGFPVVAMQHNWDRLRFDPDSIDSMLLSHGHTDHFAALPLLLKQRHRPLPLTLHPEAFLKRALLFPDGTQVELERLPHAEQLQAWGAALDIRKESKELAPGLASTGEVPRRTEFEGNLAAAYAWIDGAWRSDPFRDDQGLMAVIRDRGLVVISGCAHAGIVNTILQAQALTGIAEVFAVVGGFHLTGAPKKKIKATIAAIKGFDPALVVATHCTGFEAKCAMAHAMPDAFKLNAVGTRIELSAT